MDSKDFNSNWMVRLDWEEIHCLIGYHLMKEFLDDEFEKVMNCLNACKRDKCIIKPFYCLSDEEKKRIHDARNVCFSALTALLICCAVLAVLQNVNIYFPNV